MLKAMHAIVCYGNEMTRCTHAEVFRIEQGRLIDPSPVTIEMLKEILPKPPKKKGEQVLWGRVPPGTIAFAREQLVWRVRPGKRKLMFRIGSSKEKVEHVVNTRGHILMYSGSSMYAFLEVKHGLLPMPLPNVSANGRVCLGNYQRPADIKEPIQLADHMEGWLYEGSLFTEHHLPKGYVEHYLQKGDKGMTKVFLKKQGIKFLEATWMQ